MADNIYYIKKIKEEKPGFLSSLFTFHSDQDSFSEEDRFLAGIEKTCEVIECAYGAAGGNSIVEHDLYPFHEVTNDGKTMMDAVQLSNRFERIGSNFMKEAADKADKDSGDGRKTTALLTRAIIREAKKVDALPMEIKRSLKECLPIILESIDSEKKQITPEEVKSVALIASENETIASLLQEIYMKIGKDGIVELDNSNTFESFYEIKEGIRFRNAGFMSPYMINDKDRAVYKKPDILITKQKINTVNDLNPIFSKLTTKGTNECVIYCDDIDNSVINALAFTNAQGIFKALVIKAPTLWKDWFFEDFAKATGATIIEPSNGIFLKDVELSHLGTCDKLITTKEDTTIIGFKDLSAHIKHLEEQNTNESKLRASWLNGNAAVLKLGANSESELSLITKKAKDGRNASFLALKDGVVVGGGVSLVNAIDKLPDTIGGIILKRALLEPASRIIRNYYGDDTKAAIGGVVGFDALNGKSVNMWDAKIIDPAIVVKNAVSNAISIAGSALTAKTLIALNPKKQNESNRSMPIL